MCGIAGFFGEPPFSKFVEHALLSLASRGPDGNGIWKSADRKVALIHTRLAILDLSDASSQPMISEEEEQWAEDRGQKAGGRHQRSVARESSSNYQLSTILHSPSCNSQQLTLDSPLPLSVLVFNGEIYNYRELRRELEAAGEVFNSGGDTEVLLRLLVREGAACLPKLAGMFAFAFWNDATGEALLVRDPLGIKPLYYRDSNSSLAFASESKVLFHDGDAIDPTGLRDYFLWGSVPDPQTVHLPIRQLPAGHLMKWKDGKVTAERWYYPHRGEGDLSTSPYRVLWEGLSAPAVVTRIALEESILRHLVSDVPVGIFLSGGIDSTVLLALARKALGADADIRTFSIGFDDPEFDESSIARRTAEHFGSHHTEWRMTPEEGAAEIPAFLQAMDQPGIDGFNTWCVSKLAQREGMKVVLSGLGGDELFAGYSSFDRVPQYRHLYNGIGALRIALGYMLDLKPPGSPLRRLAAFLQGNGEWLEAYHVQRGIFTTSEAEKLSAHFAGCVNFTPGIDWSVSDLPDDPRDVVSHLEITRYMRYQLLRDSDVYSMAHSLELRVPFVDVRLIESISQIPSHIRLQQGKKLLLEAMPEIPEWVRNQPKRGFRFPFQSWMESSFREMLEEASRESPVVLQTWYRNWAVAAAVRSISRSA